MNVWAIIAAAGGGTRLASAGLDRPKQFFEMNGAPLYWHSARTFAAVAGIRGAIFVFPPALLAAEHENLNKLAKDERFPLPFQAVAGGDTRRDSVRNALSALPAECDAVLVHDAARPFVSAKLVSRVIAALEEGNAAVIPGVPLVDTIKEVDADNFVAVTHDRNILRAVQTPQGFSRAKLRAAHEEALARSLDMTDDAMLMEQTGVPVRIVDGDGANVKITTPEDLALVRGGAPAAPPILPRTGFGYDVHAYGGTRPLILGGVPIPSNITVSAHSDGDVLLHALVDAVLGCSGHGDIGTLFPDTNPEFSGMESGIFLSEALRAAFAEGFKVVHADMTIVAQAPKLMPYKEQIRSNIAKLLGLLKNAVNVKATTEEKLGFTGEKKGIKAYAVVTAVPHPF
jgi:2-C-methyl-D-erythritol 4-phosphate cytidylyltransferase/2-C-methyl-D-erythritol 2,4-cyclodiphosphate synthase